MATVYGKISDLKTKKGFKTKMPMAEGKIEDLSGKIKITWFNQAYLAKMIHDDENVKLTGKVTQGKNGIYLANPEFEKMPYMPIDMHNTLFRPPRPLGAPQTPREKNVEGFSYPIYAETRGITSKWFYHALERIFKEKTLDHVEDYIPEDILKKYHLPTLKTALIWIHKPKDKKDAEAARKRFAFEEVFCIQLERQHDKFEYRKNKSFQIKAEEKNTEDFLKRFPFEPTNSQKKSIETILNDMARNFPMSRLLEGDVGSGKTAVAATASYVVVNQRPNGQSFGNLQVAYMAPTEILATQHFESFIEYFKHLPISVGLITGSGCRKFPSKVNPSGWTTISRAQLLKWVANGEIPILIGTHALIQKSVQFKNLALIVIDEQHRFGVKQRMMLRRKHDIAPHLLSMTATPIPRTLALTIFGDLDLSILDELPPGRQLPETKIILPHEREEIYEKVRRELKSGRQVFVICPRVNDPDPDKENTINAKSVKSESERLQKKIFPEFKVGSITGQMKPTEKEKIMRDFKDKKIDILVATSVIEVGVNVPNATVIIIENAERFGLAGLHQLRGRVLRSSFKPYCFVFADSKSDKTISRLKSFANSSNGFELAEADLQQRGTGDLAGAKQWGISDLAMEALKNIKMVEAARTEAKRLIEEDFNLKKYPALLKHIASKQAVHME